MFQSCNTKLYVYKNLSQILWSSTCPSQLYSDLTKSRIKWNLRNCVEAHWAPNLLSWPCPNLKRDPLSAKHNWAQLLVVIFI